MRHVVFLPAVFMLAIFQLTIPRCTVNLKSDEWVLRRASSAAPRKQENATHLNYKELTFTNFGWFQPNIKEGLKVERSWAARDFLDAVLIHDRYNQSAWEDLEHNPDPSRPILAFLDIDACLDLHFPRFGQDSKMASDRQNGRRPILSRQASFRKVCPIIERALRSPAMSAPESRLVVLSCEVNGPMIANCTNGSRDEDKYSKLVVGHLSAHKHQVHHHDFGIPPLPVKSVTLSERQLRDIQSCRRIRRSRRYLFSFTGRPRIDFPQFKNYWKHRTGKDGVYAQFGFNHYRKNPNKLTNVWGGKVLESLPPENQAKDAYYQLLKDSLFVGAPRGDNLYSVRFSEILSAGAIPVVYSDGWVLPYVQDVVDWSELAVLVPERNVSQSMEILKSIPERKACRMQQGILDFYKEFVADSHGRLRAVLKIMDARLNQISNGESSSSTSFSAAPDH